MKATKQIDPLAIIFAKDFQRQKDAENVISNKERHIPMVGAHKASIRSSTRFGSVGNMFPIGGRDFY